MLVNLPWGVTSPSVDASQMVALSSFDEDCPPYDGQDGWTG